MALDRIQDVLAAPLAKDACLLAHHEQTGRQAGRVVDLRELEEDVVRLGVDEILDVEADEDVGFGHPLSSGKGKAYILVDGF